VILPPQLSSELGVEGRAPQQADYHILTFNVGLQMLRFSIWYQTFR
jgi:hypothetical protein